MIEIGYYFTISLFIIAFTIGIISIWTGSYDNYFARLLVGPISLSKDDNDILIKKMKRIVSFSYFYNLIVLIALLVIYPTTIPIITAAMVLTIPLSRRTITKYFKNYGIKENNKFRKTNKILLWILTLGMIGAGIFLIAIDHPLSTTVIGLTIYVILAILLKKSVDFSKKRADRNPIDKMKNNFRD